MSMFYGANQILFQFAKELRANETEAEKLLWYHLSTSFPKGYRFKRQHPVLFFVADFYCHKAKLIIEIDGGYHKIPQQFEYDKARDIELNALGLKVLRFTNEDIFKKLELVLEIILKEIQEHE